jgi:DNA modification methylase
LTYNWQKDAADSYLVAIAAKREKWLVENIPGVQRARVIGRCELLQGDCNEIMPHLGTFDALVTDPPYGMQFHSNRRAERHRKIAGDASGDALAWACSLPVNHSRYVWMRWDNLADAPRPKSLITWVKNNHSMGDLEHEHGRRTEVCAFYPGPEHEWPKKRPDDVLNFPRTDNSLHPTQKPVPLMCAVVDWTRGQIIDPFMGSGTTLVAATKSDRSATGIEQDPEYFDVAVERLEALQVQPDLFLGGPL